MATTCLDLGHGNRLVVEADCIEAVYEMDDNLRTAGVHVRTRSGLDLIVEGSLEFVSNDWLAHRTVKGGS